MLKTKCHSITVRAFTPFKSGSYDIARQLLTVKIYITNLIVLACKWINLSENEDNTYVF